MSTSEPTADGSSSDSRVTTSRSTPPPAPTAPPAPPETPAKAGSSRRIWYYSAGGVALLVGLWFGVPWLIRALTTVSTDDANVNGHVTLFAARVPGQVKEVFVDDNNRVHEGDILVTLDPEPYDVQVAIAESALETARSELVSTQAQARATLGQMRGLRFNLEHAIEDVDNQVATLHLRVATLDAQLAVLEKARADYERNEPLVRTKTISQELFDQYKEAYAVAQARVEEAYQGVYQVRVALGLPARPGSNRPLTDVPADLNQTFSTVRQAQANLMQVAAQLGVSESFNKSPRQLIADFYKRDPVKDIGYPIQIADLLASGLQGQGDIPLRQSVFFLHRVRYHTEPNIDHIYEAILKEAPAIKQAEARVVQAQSNLKQARLNRSYCEVKADIDGVVTRRNVNPGNNVIAGQSLMAIRSLTEIWVDANFKETQLAPLRIGQPVDLEVDMYGKRHIFQGRISGFTMGTGSTLALLPAENATGNFVKVVQRVPVRIDLIDYDPEKAPLIIGTSVTPYVRVREQATGPDAGKVLQPYLSTLAAKKEGQK